MSFTTELLTGIAVELDTAGAGVWSPTGGYGAGDTAIVFRAFPSSPDRAIALATYTVADDPTLSDSVQGLQVRTRGTKDPRVVDDIDDAVFDALQALWGVELGTVKVVQIERVSAAPIGADGSGRWERIANYHVTTHRPSTHRT